MRRLVRTRTFIITLVLLFLMFLWILLGHEYLTNCLTPSETTSSSCHRIKIASFLKAVKKAHIKAECQKEVNEIALNLLQQPSKITIYVITPTHSRYVQKAELKRLSYCFRLVPNLHWIVVEDREKKTDLVSNLLESSTIPYTHLNVLTPSEYKMKVSDPNWLKPRGVLQRNLALKWLRDTFTPDKDKGVVYFADDDNTYDIDLFEIMRETKTVSVWPVAFVGGLIVERPLIKEGKVVGWNSLWKTERVFPLDMAGFAINLKLILQHPEAQFDLSVPRGYQETQLLQHLVAVKELEPKADNCTKVLVWHTRTEWPKLKQEKKLKVPSNTDFEV